MRGKSGQTLPLLTPPSPLSGGQGALHPDVFGHGANSAATEADAHRLRVILERSGDHVGRRPTPGGRLQAEMGYGFAAFDMGLLTPYAGTVLAQGVGIRSCPGILSGLPPGGQATQGTFSALLSQGRCP